MKSIITFIAALSLAFGAAAQTKTDKATKDELQTITIKTSAVCDMCKETIEKAMAFEKGVKTSELNVDTKILTVTFNPKKTSDEKIKKAVTFAGYDADEMPADPKAYENLDPCCKKDAVH